MARVRRKIACKAQIFRHARQRFQGYAILIIVLFGICLFATTPVHAQVSPAEIVNPQSKQLESTYLQDLKKLNRDIEAAPFPFTFFLSRYVGLDRSQEAETDTRGIEFGFFQNRTILKITGNYDAAFNANLLTENERARRVFQDVMVPILQLVGRDVPTDVPADTIGLEICYHVRTPSSNYDYEGKQILVVVFQKADAFMYVHATDNSSRQDILNRSNIFVDGQPYGLALEQRQPFSLEALGRTDPGEIAEASPSQMAGRSQALTFSSTALPVDTSDTMTPVPHASSPRAPGVISKPVTTPADISPPTPALTQADADREQAKLQLQFNAFAKDGTARLHFVEYAPPSLFIFHNQMYLQITMRNPSPFNREASSIYKRAAQSFDLFLAPQMKDLLEKLPTGIAIAGVDITVLNGFIPQTANTSEAAEFICPLIATRRFASAEITNQELIDQSAVLVNGVRIALNLQLVE